MKHYAYHNMSRRTQLTTKFIFQVMAQLTENFIFIYLGLSLFTDAKLIFKPLFIMVAVVGICVARWCAVFPLSRLINWFIRYRAQRRGSTDTSEEIPYSHQAMIFWAGLRGAVGVALAAGLSGANSNVLRATILVVVVLTVIIFGGTTARMLEILEIRTGVVEEIDSDDEFDIEYVGASSNGMYARTSGKAIGHNPRLSGSKGFALGDLDNESDERRGGFATGSNGAPHAAPNGKAPHPSRRNSSRSRGQRTMDTAEHNLLSASPAASDDEVDLDLPPAARRTSPGTLPPQYPISGIRADLSTPPRDTSTPTGRIANATSAVTQLISGITEDPASAFRQIDEGFIKPHLLLDPGNGGGGGGGGSSGGSPSHQ